MIGLQITSSTAESEMTASGALDGSRVAGSRVRVPG